MDIIDWRYRELPAVRHEGPVQPFVAVLVETGTASHPAEAVHLATEKGNVWLAQAHAEALDQWMRAEVALLRFAQDGFHDPPPETLPAEQVNALTYGEVTHGRTDDPPRMSFTFDAGTSAAYWPQLRDALRARGITTTIFLTGEFIRLNPAVVREMLAEGHDLQNHSDTHPDFTQMSAPAIQAELRGAQAALDNAIGAHLPMRLWRPPFGSRNEAVWRAAAEIGMLCIWWSRTGDTTGWQEGVTAQDVYDWVVWNFQPGQIYVGHVNSLADVEAIDAILDEALAQGYVIGDLWSILTPEQVAALNPPPGTATSGGAGG
ncbi:MAG: polysaccharide deacetylase family protein [Anaerolineae bacterium]|nr:polysaccharide deacetylase family protein [Anaerolineae bacterium]